MPQIMPYNSDQNYGAYGGSGSSGTPNTMTDETDPTKQKAATTTKPTPYQPPTNPTDGTPQTFTTLQQQGVARPPDPAQWSDATPAPYTPTVQGAQLAAQPGAPQTFGPNGPALNIPATFNGQSTATPGYAQDAASDVAVNQMGSDMGVGAQQAPYLGALTVPGFGSIGNIGPDGSINVGGVSVGNMKSMTPEQAQAAALAAFNQANPGRLPADQQAQIGTVASQATPLQGGQPAAPTQADISKLQPGAVLAGGAPINQATGAQAGTGAIAAPTGPAGGTTTPANAPALSASASPSSTTTGTTGGPNDILSALLTGVSGKGAGSDVQNATTAAELAQLKTPNPYLTDAVAAQEKAGNEQIDQQQKAAQKQLDEYLASRGIAASSFGGGYQGDLAGQFQTARDTLQGNILTDMANQTRLGTGQAVAQGQSGATSAQNNSQNWLSQLMGYGQQGFNNDLATNAQNQSAADSYRNFLLQMLMAGYSGGATA